MKPTRPAILISLLWAIMLFIIPSCSDCAGLSCPGNSKLKIVDDCRDPGLAVEGTFHEAKGLMYSKVGDLKLELDLFWPKGKGPFPLVVLLHAGGWISGKREDLVHEQRMLVEQGFAAATVDYRLAVGKDTKFPAAIADARCAVRFLRAVAGRYRLDPQRVVVMGNSAGGHLAALLAAAGEDPRLDGEHCKYNSQPITVSGAVAFYAPLDLRASVKVGVPDEIITTFLGQTSTENPELAALASPITHLDPKDPPFLLAHGAEDILVPVQLSRDFKKALDRHKIPSLYVEVKDTGHGFFMFKGEEVKFRRSTCTTTRFLRTILNMPPRPPPVDPPAEEDEKNQDKKKKENKK